MRVNHTYRRGGALAYLAAYDVHHARVLGRTEERTGIVPFMNLVTQVMSTEPYASAKRVYWIADNGSSHRGKKTADRITPVHAFWLNQVEIYFSVVQRKVTSPTSPRSGIGSEPSKTATNTAAQPFQWRFTTLRPGRSAG